MVNLNSNDINALKRLTFANEYGSARICAHDSDNDKLHEMVIAHSFKTYVRPHKHLGKSVSFHVIDGLADVVTFDDNGIISQVIPMGSYTTGLEFYYRLSECNYYMQLVRSEMLIFHEVILGPFDRSNTRWAPWAPDRSETTAAESFLDDLVKEVDIIKAKCKTGEKSSY